MIKLKHILIIFLIILMATSMASASTEYIFKSIIPAGEIGSIDFTYNGSAIWFDQNLTNIYVNVDYSTASGIAYSYFYPYRAELTSDQTGIIHIPLSNLNNGGMIRFPGRNFTVSINGIECRYWVTQDGLDMFVEAVDGVHFIKFPWTTNDIIRVDIGYLEWGQMTDPSELFLQHNISNNALLVQDIQYPQIPNSPITSLSMGTYVSMKINDPVRYGGAFIGTSSTRWTTPTYMTGQILQVTQTNESGNQPANVRMTQFNDFGGGGAVPLTQLNGTIVQMGSNPQQNSSRMSMVTRLGSPRSNDITRYTIIDENMLQLGFYQTGTTRVTNEIQATGRLFGVSGNTNVTVTSIRFNAVTPDYVEMRNPWTMTYPLNMANYPNTQQGTLSGIWNWISNQIGNILNPAQVQVYGNTFSSVQFDNSNSTASALVTVRVVAQNQLMPVIVPANSPPFELTISAMTHPIHTPIEWQLSYDPLFRDRIPVDMIVNEVDNTIVTKFYGQSIVPGTLHVRGRVTGGQWVDFSGYVGTTGINITDTTDLRIYFVDGVTGGYIHRVGTVATGIALPQVVFSGATARQLTNNDINATFLNPIQFTQSGITQNITPTHDFHGFTVYIPNLIIGEPFDLVFNSATVSYQNMTYTGLIIAPSDPILSNLGTTPNMNLSVARGLSAPVNAETTAGVNGIIYGLNGTGVSNALIIQNNATTGAFVSQQRSQAGGQYWIATAGTNVFTVSAQGYQNEVFVMGGGGMRMTMLRSIFDISIRVYDFDTGERIQFFTTFLGDNLIMRSTDVGMVHYRNVTEGEQQVIVQTDGYGQISRTLAVTTGSTDFILYMRKLDSSTIFQERNFVSFIIIDKNGAPIFNTNLQVFNERGVSLIDRNLQGASRAVVEIERSGVYDVIVSRNNQILFQGTISGVSLGAMYYIIIDSQGDTKIDFGNAMILQSKVVGETWQLIVKSLNDKETISIKTVSATWSSIGGGSGVLSNPTIQSTDEGVIITYDISHLPPNAVLQAEIEATNGQQTAKRIIADIYRVSRGILFDIGLTSNVMGAVAMGLIFIVAIFVSNASANYLPVVVTAGMTSILIYAGWLSLPATAVVLLCIGVIIVVYNQVAVR